ALSSVLFARRSAVDGSTVRGALASCPTRRSSDLVEPTLYGGPAPRAVRPVAAADADFGIEGSPRPLASPVRLQLAVFSGLRPHLDRKSTRLNSSHVKISYAVFCLKKKTNHRHAKI